MRWRYRRPASNRRRRICHESVVFAARAAPRGVAQRKRQSQTAPGVGVGDDQGRGLSVTSRWWGGVAGVNANGSPVAVVATGAATFILALLAYLPAPRLDHQCVYDRIPVPASRGNVRSQGGKWNWRPGHQQHAQLRDNVHCSSLHSRHSMRCAFRRCFPRPCSPRALSARKVRLHTADTSARPHRDCVQ